jgi:hypothetical protein
MKRVKAVLAVLTVVATLVASAVPAMASSGGDDFCFWSWSWEWGWFVSCVDDDGFDDGFDDGDHHGGGGNSGPG